MNWRKVMLRAGLACFAVGLGWFLLMAVLPGTFPFYPDFGWIFVPGIALLWLGTRGGEDDDIWPVHGTDADGPFNDWASEVSLDEAADD